MEPNINHGPAHLGANAVAANTPQDTSQLDILQQAVVNNNVSLVHISSRIVRETPAPHRSLRALWRDLTKPFAIMLNGPPRSALSFPGWRH